MQAPGGIEIFRVVGGAPVYVSSWSVYGGRQRVQVLSWAQWAALAQRPADGTYIRDAVHGYVYRIAGGAPVYVSSWAVFGGAHPTVDVDPAAIANAGRSGVWGHLNYRPADGAFVHDPVHGYVYRIAGGAPIYVSSWAVFGGAHPTVDVDPAAIANAGRSGVWGHLNYRPANGTFLQGLPGIRIYIVQGGVPRYVTSWAKYGGPRPFVPVSQASIDHAGAGGVYNHLAKG